MFNRRHFLAKTGAGFGALAAASLLHAGAKPPHFPTKIKTVIYLFMHGGVSHIDTWVLSTDPTEHTRRAVYMIQKRTFRLPMMEVFDAPESMQTCARRESSTSAPQSLSLFNGDFLLRQAKSLAKSLNEDPIETAWQRVLVRPPTPSDRKLAEAFLAQQEQNSGTREAALTELLRGLFNLNEFLYVD